MNKMIFVLCAVVFLGGTFSAAAKTRVSGLAQASGVLAGADLLV